MGIIISRLLPDRIGRIPDNDPYWCASLGLYCLRIFSEELFEEVTVVVFAQVKGIGEGVSVEGVLGCVRALLL